MIDGMVLHPRALQHIQLFIDGPSHALLIVGAHGIGKTYVAHHLVSHILGMPQNKIAEHQYVMHISPSGASISIEAIRELRTFLQLRTLGNERPIRRAVIIEHAEALTTEAQNAFLKILEEPPADTIIILTAPSKRTLLPTILSRVQTLDIPAPHEADVRAYFDSRADSTALNQAFFLSGGLPGLMDALLSGDTSHPLMNGVTTAKTILQHKTFERLAMVESLCKNKEAAGYTLEALQHIARTSITSATVKSDMSRLKQWHKILVCTTEARDALAVNANPKLTLTNLMLAL